MSIPLRKTVRRLTHRSVSDSNTICNGQSMWDRDITIDVLHSRTIWLKVSTPHTHHFNLFFLLTHLPNSLVLMIRIIDLLIGLLGEGHTLINGVLFFSPTNVGYHNPPPSGPNKGSSVLADTLPYVYPLRGTARRLAHRPVSGSDTISNGQSMWDRDITIDVLHSKNNMA